MNTQVVFSIKDLIYIALWIVLILFIVYLIILLKEFIISLRTVRKLIQERRAEIDEIIIKVPGIMDNVEKITGVTAKGMNSAYDGASKIAKKFKKEKNEERPEQVEEIIIG